LASCAVLEASIPEIIEAFPDLHQSPIQHWLKGHDDNLFKELTDIYNAVTKDVKTLHQLRLSLLDKHQTSSYQQQHQIHRSTNNNPRLQELSDPSYQPEHIDLRFPVDCQTVRALFRKGRLPVPSERDVAKCFSVLVGEDEDEGLLGMVMMGLGSTVNLNSGSRDGLFGDGDVEVPLVPPPRYEL
ncbi:hypothetical protein HDU76_009730, partial [Blyttiomyces sp. JEL0837]